jgi:hypothetical protein
MHSVEANHVTAFDNKVVSRDRPGMTHVEAVSFYGLRLATPFRRQIMTATHVKSQN